MGKVRMLNPGDRFGDYTVVRLLGEGGMGSVFLLENAEGAEVAAKILDPENAGDHESRRRFLREAELAFGVKHPNLVETYDVGEDPETGLCYILMEYVSGGSLADRIEAGPLPINDAVGIVYQIASVLELARQKGVVHRDIKPENILFGADGTPKLADLGIARGGLAGTHTTTVTHTGMMIGTPAYMAPEQMLDAHGVDVRADIYSLGIVLFEMLTGERPNKDDTVVQLMAKAVKGDPLPDVRALRPDVPAALAKLLARMIAPKKEKRMASPLQLAIALEIIERGGVFRVWMENLRSRGKLLLPVGVILVGIAVACFAPLLRTGNQKKPLPQAVPTKVPSPQTVVKVESRTNESEKAKIRSIPPSAEKKSVAPPVVPTPEKVLPLPQKAPDVGHTNAVASQGLPTQLATNSVRSASPEVPKVEPAEKKETKKEADSPRPAKPPETVPVAKTGTEVAYALKNTKLAQVAVLTRQPLSKAIGAIRAALNPQVNFCFLRDAEMATSSYSFVMENVKALNALKSLCNAAGCSFEVHDNVVCIAPKERRFRWKSAATDTVAASVRTTLSELRFSKFNVSSRQRTGDVLELFRKKTDAERPYVGIRWIDGHSAEDRLPDLVPMNLGDVSVWTALELFCNTAECDFDCRAKSVELHPLAGRGAAAQKESSRFSRTEILRMRDPDGEEAMRRSIERMFRGWRMCRTQQTGLFRKSKRLGDVKSLNLGYVAEHLGKIDVLRTCGTGELMEYRFEKPVGNSRCLSFWASGDPDTQIIISDGGKRILKDCGTLGVSGWRYYDIDLWKFKGERPTLTIAVRGRAGEPCVMQWHGIEVR